MQNVLEKNESHSRSHLKSVITCIGRSSSQKDGDALQVASVVKPDLFKTSTRSSRPRNDSSVEMAPLVDNPLIASATLHNPCKSKTYIPTGPFTKASNSATLFARLCLAFRHYLAHIPSILSLRRTVQQAYWWGRMDFRVVRNDYYGAKSGLAEHALERQFEISLHLYNCQEGFGSEVDQSSSCHKCRLCGHLRDCPRQRM